MTSSDPNRAVPSARAGARAGRRGRLLPLTAAGTGVVLVVISAVLLLHNRALPADFGAVPGSDGQRPAAALSAAAVDPAVASASRGTPAPGRGQLANPSPPVTTPPVTTPPSTIGRISGPSARRATTGPRAAVADTTSAHRTTASTTRPPVSTTTRRTAPATDPRELPHRLLLPRFGIHADVLPVTSTNGALAVPDNPQQVGWWVGSALPGSATGTTVIDGHIDSATAGVGALIHLSDLQPGDSVSIEGSTGRTLRYQVVARRVYVKNAGLPSSLFATGGPQQLLLISCGGPFDSSRGSYEDNIVVYATPVAD